MTAGVELPHRAIREQISSAFDVLVQISRLVDGSRRVTHITEVLRMESDVITLQTCSSPRRRTRRRSHDARLAAAAPARLHRPEAALPREDGGNGVILPPTFFRTEAPDGRRSAPRRTGAGSEAASARPPLRRAAGRRYGRLAEDREPRHGRATPPSAQPSTPKRGRRRQLTENGRPVVGFRAVNLGREKSVMLLFDRSQSMIGQAIADASAAARQFVSSKPARDRIAVVAVGKKAVQLTSFSANAAEADDALRTIEVDKVRGTALYDGILVSTQALAADINPTRVLILLTDGQEVSSDASLEQAIAAAREAQVAVYAIGIESPSFRPAPLQRLAEKTGGRYVGASGTKDLKAIYAALAEELRRTWQLSYVTPRGRATRSRSRLPASAPSRSSRRPRRLERRELEAPRAVLHDRSRRSRHDRRLPRPDRRALPDAGAGRLPPPPPDQPAPRRAGAQDLPSPDAGALHDRVQPAEGDGEAPSVTSVRGSTRSIACSSGADLSPDGGARLRLGRRGLAGQRPCSRPRGCRRCSSWALMVVAGAPSRSSSSGTRRRRLAAIDEQLPDLLVTLAASLKAGQLPPGDPGRRWDEARHLASEEFKRVLTETRLGRPMDDALADMAARIGSKNVTFVVTAVTIQRQVGGSLAGIFDMVADAVRNRQQFARKIRSLTAMGRASAYVLVGVPFFMLGTITLLSPEYMDPSTTRPRAPSSFWSAAG